MHDFEHGRNHDLAGRIVRLQEIVLAHAFCQQLSDLCGSHLGKGLFVGLGIIDIFASNETVAVANEPHFATQSAIKNDRRTKALLRVLLHTLYRKAQPVVAAQSLGSAYAELMARCVGGHLTDIATDEHHGVAAIADTWAMVTLGLGSASVDHGDEIICDDQAVFAFLCGALRYEVLLDDFHFDNGVLRGRRKGAK